MAMAAALFCGGVRRRQHSWSGVCLGGARDGFVQRRRQIIDELMRDDL